MAEVKNTISPGYASSGGWTMPATWGSKPGAEAYSDYNTWVSEGASRGFSKSQIDQYWKAAHGSLPTEQAAAKTQLSAIESKREAKVAAREQEVRSIFDDIIAMYSPEGAYGQGTLAMLDRQKTRDVASATQSLVSSGLFNTTQQAGLGKKWEEEVGMPTRAKLEDVRYGALAGAKAQKAQAISNIEDQQIDYNLIAQLMQTGYGA